MSLPLNPLFFLVFIVCSFFLSSCDSPQQPADQDGQETGSLPPGCEEDNAGLVLPAGFCAGVVADSLGFIRHLVVNDNGDIYVTLRNNRLNLGGLLALRDSNADGHMDIIRKFSDVPGMGIDIAGGYLYFASDTTIYRYRLLAGELLPAEPPEVIVKDLPDEGLHAGKPFSIAEDRYLYVNIGSASNACQQEPDVAGSPGMDPCPELGQRAGIWRFDATRLQQTQAENGYHFASGIRNAYALDWHPAFRRLYVVQHGRDHLHELWPDSYSPEAGARLPAEEFFQVGDGKNYSWPYCYYDPFLDRRILAPEYGGDGKAIGRCDQYAAPLVAFPAHYSPNDLKFYSARQFPPRYHNGAFIAFHGSYNRGDFEQVGYQVVFVPFSNGRPEGKWEVFIDGFAGDGQVDQPEDADYRPTGLAVGADGSLYIADSVQGRIWRVQYTDDVSEHAKSRP